MANKKKTPKMSAWGRYSPLRRMRHHRERKPQKLWLELLGKSYVGLIYWTVLVEFLRNVFWFQLRAGGLAPQLGFLAYLFIPCVVVGRPFFREFLEKNPWSRALLLVGGVLGLWGQWEHSTARRVTLSATGVGLLGIYVWEGMWATTTARRERTAFGMVGGILLLQVLRWAFAGPNPLVARWWGLVFLGIIPGICTALLVLSEDLAESEGEELQSFLQTDPEVELEEIRSRDSMILEDGDSWRYQKLEIVNEAVASGNREDRQDANFHRLTAIPLPVSANSADDSRSVIVEHKNDNLEGLSSILTPIKEYPADVVDRSINKEHLFGNGNSQTVVNMPMKNIGSASEEKSNGLGHGGTSEEDNYLDIKWHDEDLEILTEEVPMNSGKEIRLLQVSNAEEVSETSTPKSFKNDIFQRFNSWSGPFGGFGVDAFREARTETPRAVVDPPENSTRLHESLQELQMSSSPMKNKRWGEGEEVPWLLEIKGNNDISESELDRFRHKDTKWTISGCLRTAQRGIGSGSLLFITHWVLTAPTSFPRWQGTSVQHGWLSIISLAFGLLAATEYPRIPCLRRTQGLVFWALAALGTILFLFNPSWAMLGSTLLAFSAPSLWISIAQSNPETYPGGGLGIMTIVYIAFLFWSTSLLAYQSISELSFLRGTRSILMGWSVIGVGLGVSREVITALKERKEKDSDTEADHGVWNGLPTGESEIPGRQAVGALIAVVGLIGAVAVGVRIQHTPSFLWRHGGPMKILNFNVQQGYSRAGTVNYDTILSMLHHEQPHVAMLQETDMMHIVHGNLDMIDYLSTWMKMHSLYTPPTKSDTWGCAILSFYPFIYSKSGILLSPSGENACFQYAQIEVHGKIVHLINTHFGTLETEVGLQAQELAALVKTIFNEHGQETVWLVLAGDLNTAPLTTSYNVTLGAGLVDTYVGQHGEWMGPSDRDPGAGYVFTSPTLNCTSWEELRYDQQKTADGYPIVATFEFIQ